MSINQLIGQEVQSLNPKHTQVYMATHEGERRLPFMNRSFISFSYGGKNIEDFNLIATVSGDRWEKDGYADFEDLTTDYDVINGRFYWNTYFHTNTFQFELSTDSITQQELDEFLRWFKAGQIKELILAEHPNRAILARVSEVPKISMIPFELKKEVMIDGAKYVVTTTEYKGTINLSLTSDDPFWYAKVNILGNFDTEIIFSDWKNANGEAVPNLIDDPDVLKIIFEDGIPLSSMIKETIALGGEVYATVDAELRSQICTPISAEEYADAVQNNASWYFQEPNADEYYFGARITSDNSPIETALGLTAGTMMSNYGSITLLNNVTSANYNYTYFYYPGTAPSPLKMEFDFYPEIDSSTYLITSPSNKYSPIIKNGQQNFYNSIYIESLHVEELRLTTPNIFTSYNQVINMFDTQLDETWVLIRKLIRDTVHHAIIRKWANKVIDILDDDSDTCNDENNTLAKQYMSQLFTAPINADETFIVKAHILIDSKTGNSTGTFYFRDPDSDIEVNNTASEQTANLYQSQENVQDMLLSNDLIIRDRNFPNSDGQIVRWEDSNDTTRTYSHRMYHDLPVSLHNVRLIYQNLYL